MNDKTNLLINGIWGNNGIYSEKVKRMLDDIFDTTTKKVKDLNVIIYNEKSKQEVNIDINYYQLKSNLMDIVNNFQNCSSAKRISDNYNKLKNTIINYIGKYKKEQEKIKPVSTNDCLYSIGNSILFINEFIKYINDIDRECNFNISHSFNNYEVLFLNKTYEKTVKGEVNQNNFFFYDYSSSDLKTFLSYLDMVYDKVLGIVEINTSYVITNHIYNFKLDLLSSCVVDKKIVLKDTFSIINEILSIDVMDILEDNYTKVVDLFFEMLYILVDYFGTPHSAGKNKIDNQKKEKEISELKEIQTKQQDVIYEFLLDLDIYIEKTHIKFDKLKFTENFSFIDIYEKKFEIENNWNQILEEFKKNRK